MAQASNWLTWVPRWNFAGGDTSSGNGFEKKFYLNKYPPL